MTYLYTDIGLLVIILGLLFLVLRLNKRIKALTDNTNADSIEQLIQDYYVDISNLKAENLEIVEKIDSIHSELLDKLDVHNEWLMKTFCKYDIMRYNPFEDVGGELSFVLTCLDANNSGYVLNSIYSQNFSQTYIKPIENGFCDINLSYEEMESLKRAINKKL